MDLNFNGMRNTYPDYTSTDDDTDYYDDDYDDDTDDNDYELLTNIIYECEDISPTKYDIVLCCKFNSVTHGSCLEMEQHYLTYCRIKKFDILRINMLRYFQYTENTHLEIAECMYLPSGHCISIIKTHWLRLIQRSWKKIFKQRKNIIERRSTPSSLKYREIYGKWPNNCVIYPSLHGMLYNLS